LRTDAEAVHYRVLIAGERSCERIDEPNKAEDAFFKPIKREYGKLMGDVVKT